MNLPNLLTLLRIFFVPLLMATLLAENSGAAWQNWIPASPELFALAVFLAAAVPDLPLGPSDHGRHSARSHRR
jgi:phosphatidylglycerophosphate synthase